jgi:hypothetical protein
LAARRALVGLDHTVSPGGENREVGGLGVRCGAVQDVAAKPSDTDQERPQRCRVGSAPAAEPGDRPPRYTGRLDDYAFWERLERWTHELGADPASAMVVGGGDVVGSEQAGRELRYQPLIRPPKRTLGNAPRPV